MKPSKDGVLNRQQSEFLIGLDIETTGIDRANDLLLEVALVAVNRRTREIVDRWETVVKHDPQTLDVRLGLNDYVRKMHETNGLAAEIREGKGVDVATALVGVRAFVVQYPGATLLGRNVGTFDREFLEAQLQRLGGGAVPLFEGCSYRHFDLSSILLLLKGYAPAALILELPEPGEAHRAMADIVGDVALLDYLADSAARWLPRCDQQA